MDYNDCASWGHPDLHTEPAFDKANYQRRVDEICGLNEFGKPNVLLTWLPSIENYERKFCEWDKAGFGTKTELRARYVAFTLNIRGDELEIPPPRWGLKQFVPTAQQNERTRWKRADSGSQTFVRESRPERDPKNYYVPCLKPLSIIASHNGFCCRKAKRDGNGSCFGFYRLPDEHYLILLKKAVENRAKDGSDRPEAGFTERTLNAAAREAAAEIAENERRADASMDALITENLPSALAYYTGDKSFLDNGRIYALPNGNK